MPDSPSTARELLVRLSNSRRDVWGCSRVRESSRRIAGLVFRTKRTTAIEPANNGPRFQPKLPTDQTQTTQEPFTDKSPAPARAGGLCPRGALWAPPRFIASAPIPESNNRNGTPRECYSGVPSPVLAPGAALGSRLRVALSSGQVDHHDTRPALSARTQFRCARSTKTLSQGRILSRTDCSACVIRDPGASNFGRPAIFRDRDTSAAHSRLGGTSPHETTVDSKFQATAHHANFKK